MKQDKIHYKLSITKMTDDVYRYSFTFKSTTRNKLIGTASVYLIQNLFSLNEEQKLSVLATPSTSCLNLYYPLFIHEEEISVQSLPEMPKKLIFLDSLNIKKSFRGTGFGSRIMVYLVKRFHSDQILFATQAYPVSFFEDKLNELVSDKKRERAFLKREAEIMDWYRGFGFAALGDSSHMILINKTLAKSEESVLKMKSSIRRSTPKKLLLRLEQNPIT